MSAIHILLPDNVQFGYDGLVVEDKFMNLKFRQATREDLPEIVRMLADDFLGATRERYETPLPESYVKAFEEIDGG